LKGVEKALLGRKLGMTQIFGEGGRAEAVTVIAAGPCHVVQRKSAEKDGYDALQLGFEEVKPRRLNKPRMGHLKKAGEKAGSEFAPLRHLVEFRMVNCDAYPVGSTLRADVFVVGETVAVTSVSKGKGFAGVQKRYHFSGGPASHGSMSHRRPASSGATDAGRTFKGWRKPGHMGNVRVTQRGMRVTMVDVEKGVLAVHGSVPGPTGALVMVTRQAAAGKAAKEGE
jgi:large subunit ribosomal protein L3